jgi:hypothetical protein
MTVKLLHYDNQSAISLFDKDNHYGWIFYENRAHKPFSEIDYKTLVTENNTYSDNAVIELFEYLKQTRNAKLESARVTA